MISLLDVRVRQLLPRWRDAARTAALGELVSSSGPVVRDFTRPGLIEQKQREWREQGSSAFAADLLATAIVSADKTTARAAASELSKSLAASDVLTTRVVDRVLGPPAVSLEEPALAAIDTTRSRLHARVRHAKARVSRDYGNALAWADLAKAYAAVGLMERSREAMAHAIALAPNDRFVLRSAARLFVHQRDPQHGLWLLRASPLAATDPWLIASEVALSGLLGKPSELAKTGRGLAEAQRFSDFDLSELRGALATLEGAAGNLKKARKLFRLALAQPNDNVVAQAVWAHRYLGTAEVGHAALGVPLSFEARARDFVERQDWQLALDELLKWLDDQPFSVDPAIHASYVAGVVLDNHEYAIEIIRRGMIANPNDWTLRNNLVFSLATLDRVVEASSIFSVLPPEEANVQRHGVWSATAGLMRFRAGDFEAGRSLYDEAIDIFTANHLPNALASAAFFKAREISRLSLPDAPEALRRAQDFLMQATYPEKVVLTERLRLLTTENAISTTT